MSLLTSKKLRAARQLAGLSQKDLAERSGVALASIGSYERDASVSLAEKSQVAIMRTLLEYGVEIAENHVGYVKDTVVTYTGHDGFANFKLDVFKSISNNDDKFVCVSNVNERDFVKWDIYGHDINKHAIRMKSIDNLDMKILVKEGDDYLPASDYATYRWVPEDRFFEGGPIYVYGEKTAFIIFSENDVKVFIISQPHIAALFRQQFMDLWEKSREPECIY